LWVVGRQALMGVLLIGVIFVFPRGLAGGLVALGNRFKRHM
jgi:hypothetical protein